MLFTRTFIHMALSDGGGEPPVWLHLIPAGTFKGVDGRGPFRLADAHAVIAATNGEKLVLDENHSTDLAAPQGAEAPARGWITELQSREDGIWGRVEWTQSGKQLMSDKAYRGISPVFTTDEAGNVVRLLRASLTNNPNLSDLATIHSQETSVDLKKLCAALGLPETADEAAVLAAIEAGRSATAQVSAHQQQIGTIIAAAGAKASDAAGLVVELQQRQAAAGDVQTMAAKVVSLETELNAIKAATNRRNAETYVDGAIAAGKPINALRDHYVQRHMADPAAVEKEVAAMLSINAGGMKRPERNDASGDDELDAEEMAVCRKMGQDPKKFAAQKKLAMEAKKQRGW